MRTFIISLSLFLILAAWGCSKQNPPEGRPATISLKDGTIVTGMVTKSDTSSVTIRVSSGAVTTYPVSDVSSISYTSNAAPSVPSTTAVPQPAAPPTSPSPSPAASAPVVNTPPPTQPPATAEYHPDVTFRVVPAGTTISVRTSQIIDSETATPGQTYPAVIAHDVPDSAGRVAIPRGSTATLVVRNVEEQGRVKGRSELVVDIAGVQVDGRRYRLETTNFVEKGREGVGANKRTGKFAGGGGLLGGIIGAVAGGGKGAAIGALSGAAAGVATQTITRKPVRLPAESLLNFRLEAPIHVREMH